jgi:hypothetical protein
MLLKSDLYSVDLPQVILATCHFASWPFCLLAILSTEEFTCPHQTITPFAAKLSRHPLIHLSFQGHIHNTSFSLHLIFWHNKLEYLSLPSLSSTVRCNNRLLGQFVNYKEIEVL